MKKNVDTSPGVLKRKILQWAQQFDRVCLLDHNDYVAYPGQLTEGYLACGAAQIITVNIEEPGALTKLQTWLDEHKDWAFGFLSYDLKNQIEQLHSHHHTTVPFPLLSFFIPQYIFELQGDQLNLIKSKDIPEKVWKEIYETELTEKVAAENKFSLEHKFSKAEYLAVVEKLQTHIQQGDIYEVNFCQEFFSNNAVLNPLALFEKLNQNSRAPFASFFKSDHKYILCSSPERFLQKKGNQLISQPIKGTRPRGLHIKEDALLKEQLIHSAKDRAEHVMIVDLVRNDFGRCCHPGSVQVPELFGIYSFEHVHQMISLVKGHLLPEANFKSIIESTFPMGSMTGAPKVSALELIEQYERSSRGVYSGSIGYIKPDGDFDFNVVIRSMLYDQNNSSLSFQVGGAIIAASDPEEEYQECLVKSAGIRAALFG